MLATTFHVVVSTTATWLARGMLTKSFERSAVSAQSAPGLLRKTSVTSLLPPKPSSGSMTEMFGS